jgi:L-alanine-DL-glutamate epimerase-like enolase superfamily enzyme
MFPLTIQTIHIYKSAIPLKKPFIISLGTLTHAENVIVTITTQNGLIGTGECSPFKSINGESHETGFIVGQYLAKALMGKNASDIADCIAIMDKVIYSNYSIKSAFDMALYDLCAQQAGVPLYQYLGGSKNKTLVTDYTVSLDNADQMAADALWIKKQGFQVIKVKLGGTPVEDIERIRQIREAIGDDLPIRIDANQGWQAAGVPATLQALAPFNIQHCEEPIARWDYFKLPEIRKNSLIKIMADESCCTHHDAAKLINLSACDSLNVKLGKSGGIHTAIKIIDLAAQHQLPVQLGGFLESRLAFTAAAHVALSSPAVQYCDFDTPLMFITDPVKDGIAYSTNWEIEVPDMPGLGASFDASYLNSLEKATIKE